MKYMLYNPTAKIMFVRDSKRPGYAINKIRRDCYRCLNFNMINTLPIRAILHFGGLGKTKYIISNSIPFPLSEKTFRSYKDDMFAEEWLERHQGYDVTPIITYEEYDYATTNRHKWDELPDMYPIEKK